jgi:hypothetical protein
MSFFDFLKGKEEKEVNYVPGMVEDIGETLKFKKDVTMPAYRDYMKDVERTYDQNLPGMTKAAQGGAGYAGQVGQTLGETGESAARVGVSGLSQFFDPKYGQEQFTAAMSPIQAQYMQNMANQGATFGGAGQLGSSRQALAGAQAAGANQAAQMQAAAGVMRDLNNQRLQAGQTLGQLGGNYLQGGLGAKQAQLGFAERPVDYIAQKGKAMGQVPRELYTPQYPGQQGITESKTPGLKDIIGPIFSDRRVKENIKHQGQIEGVDVYTYNYIWDKEPKFGVMAQDLLDSAYASAVTTHESGYYQVDYAQLPTAIQQQAMA